MKIEDIKKEIGLPKIFTTKEAAEILGLTYQGTTALIRRGELKAKRIGRGYRISESGLKEFMERI